MLGPSISHPVFDMRPLFEKMDGSGCDWWGLYRQPVKGYGDVVSSAFVVYGSRMINSGEFWKYWKEMPQIRSYRDSVNLHELRQNVYWHECGFISGTAISYEDCNLEQKRTRTDWILCHGMDLIRAGCPLVKRRIFYFNEQIGSVPYVLTVLKILTFLGKHANYNINFIVDNIIRTQKIWYAICWIQLRILYLAVSRFLTLNHRARLKKWRKAVLLSVDLHVLRGLIKLKKG